MDFNFLKPARGQTMYNQIVKMLVYAVVFLVPLFYLPFSSNVLEINKQLLLVVVAAIGLVVWLLGIVVTGTLTFRLSSLDKGILAVWGASLVATLFSLSQTESLFGVSANVAGSFVTVTALTVLYFLAVNTIADKGNALRDILMTSIAVALGLGIAQIFGLRSFNTVGSINALGVLAAIALPLFAKTILRRSGWVTWIIALAGLIASMGLLGLLNWWVLWVIALAGMLAIVAFDSLDPIELGQSYRRRRAFSLGRFIIPTIVVVLGSFLMLIHFNVSAITNTFPVEVAPSFRLSWDVVSGVLSKRLIYGFGPEQFSRAFDQFGASQIANGPDANHTFFAGTSQIFTLLAEGGVLALLAFLCLLWCIGQTMRKQIGASGGAVGFMAALIGALAAILLYPLTLTLACVWYALIALLALSASDTRATVIDIEEHPKYALISSLGFIVMLIVVLTALYFMTIRYLGDVAYAHAMDQKTPEDVYAGLQGALRWNGSDDRTLRDASRVAVLVLKDEIAAQATHPDADRATRIQTLVTTSVQLAQQATTIAPNNPLNWSNLGDVFGSFTGLVDNIQPSAEASFRKAAELRPGDPTYDNDIGSLWLAQADVARQAKKNAADALARAERSFKDALNTAPSFGLAIYNLGTVYEREGKIPEAIAQLEKIAPYNTNSPALMLELGLLYIRAGQKDAALAALRQAVLVAPNYADARWYLALLLEDRGDIENALFNLLEIQKLNPDNPTLNAEITKLESGQRSVPPASVIDSKPL